MGSHWKPAISNGEIHDKKLKLWALKRDFPLPFCSFHQEQLNSYMTYKKVKNFVCIRELVD